MADPSPLPFDIRLMNGAASTLFVLVGVGLLAALLLWLSRSPALNIRLIELEGDTLRHFLAIVFPASPSAGSYVPSPAGNRAN